MYTDDDSDSDPVYTPPDTFACTVIGSFRLPTGETCELLAFCKTDEPHVDGRTLIARGEAAQASMEKDDLLKFWKHHDSVPPSDIRYFAFPKALDARGRMWCVYRNDDNWDEIGLNPIGSWPSNGVLVRFRS